MSHRRKVKEKHRLKHLYSQTQFSYGAGAYYDEDKKRYIRWYAPRIGKFYRRISNKKVRREKYLVNGNTYKKYFDYWWELY